ncbi:MAG: hypothetical protein ACTTH0_05135 [Eubacteriales bacterium]
MRKIKKGAIIAGAVLGGAIGGTISFTGKLAKVKPLDSLGNNILNSFLYTGEIAGEFIAGGSDIAVGAIKKDRVRLKQGANNLKSGAGKIVNNYATNFKLIGGSGAEIISGVMKKDKVRIIKGGKRLAKIITVGMLSVGAIKIDDDKEIKEYKKNKRTL